MYKIALVEDEATISSLLKRYLEEAGYEVLSVSSGKAAIDINEKIDLWILDIMLSDDISGYDVIKHIKKSNSKVPVIFSSARDQDIDKIIGFELDADDYIIKPYLPKELVLRVNKIIKRVYGNDFDNITYNDYHINDVKRTVTLNESLINLTTLEYDLLIILLKNIGRSFSREDIINTVWKMGMYGNERSVDDLVRRLRKKMPELKLETIYGYGYRLL